MSFDAIPDLLADVLQEQRNTNEVLTRLVEAIAGLRTKVASTKSTAPRAEPVVAAAANTTVDAPSVNAPAVNAPSVDVAAAATQTLPTEPAPDLPAVLDYKADVAPTFAKLLSAKGAPAVVAVLTQFGVKKGAELAPEQLPDALAVATSALAA